MTATDRPVPALNADERTTLETWLDFYRATLAMKCDGLSGEQAASAEVPPSALSMQGLVQHLAEVERNWFRRVLTGEDIGPIQPPRAESGGHDGGFEVLDGHTLSDALAAWRAETAVAEGNCRGRDLDDTGTWRGLAVSLRSIYVHMIGEYARHCGHADLLRERIDGTTGV